MTEIIIPLIALVIGVVVGFVLSQRQHKAIVQMQQQQADRRVEELQAQHASEMEQHLRLVKAELKASSEDVLRERSEQLAQENGEQMEKVLTPLQNNLKQMQQALEQSSRAHAEGMARLDQSIRFSMQESARLGERADRLSAALTGQNKTQGNFGELLLRQVLEQMGLEPGLQFTEQAMLRGNDGRPLRNTESDQCMQPDVVLHFPDERDVIIDAKMSLTAYVDYQSATDDALRAQALQRHLQSVRQHVRELSQKNYSNYIGAGRTRLDYVIMFVPQEGAYQLALHADPELYSWAFAQGVMISSTQSLYALLRMIEISWRQQRQVENQENIMKEATTMLERVQLFYERFQEVQAMLRRTQEAFTSLNTTIAPKGKSIVTSALNLIGYGAKAPKTSKKAKTFVEVAALKTEEEPQELPNDSIPSAGNENYPMH